MRPSLAHLLKVSLLNVPVALQGVGLEFPAAIKLLINEY